MTTDKTIFGLRFRANETLLPSAEDLKAFLDRPQKDSSARHGDGLAAHRDLLREVESFEQGNCEEFRSRMLCGVLRHSQFVKPAFKLAVEQYKYLLHTLAGLDFKKPTAFIKSAEDEIAKLNARGEAARKERMLGMIAEREQALAALNKTRTGLAEELTNIIAYVSENLAKIAGLCEASITLLVSEQVDQKKELDLIEDIKTHFKERLRGALQQGTITKEQMEATKEEVAQLSKRTADLMRADGYAMTQLYEAIHEQAVKSVSGLQAVMQKIGKLKDRAGDEALPLYAKAEAVLTSIVSGCRLDVKAPDLAAETENDRLLAEKRREMQNYLFELLRKGAAS